MRPTTPTTALLAATALLLAGCGDAEPPSARTATSLARQVAPATTATSTAGQAAPATTLKPARGPGRVLAGPLVYRYPGHHSDDGSPSDPGYIVFFRTRGPFARRDDVGTTKPGTLRVDDAGDNHDGYAGSFGAGTARGKCYWWTLSSAAPALAREPVGSRVAVSLALPATALQRRRATLRRMPADRARLGEPLRRIGCPLPGR